MSFLSLIWRSRFAFERVTFSPSQKGHQQNCQLKGFVCSNDVPPRHPLETPPEVWYDWTLITYLKYLLTVGVCVCVCGCLGRFVCFLLLTLLNMRCFVSWEHDAMITILLFVWEGCTATKRRAWRVWCIHSHNMFTHVPIWNNMLDFDMPWFAYVSYVYILGSLYHIERMKVNPLRFQPPLKQWVLR